MEEEETIIKLHQKFGNRWSAIAAELPGRTDNEIKNVWHTYLKKRLMNDDKKPAVGTMGRKSRNKNDHIPVDFQTNLIGSTSTSTSSGGSIFDQKQQPSQSSDVSSDSSARGYVNVLEEDEMMFMELPEIDDNFLLPNLPMDQLDTIVADFPDYDDIVPVLSNGTTSDGEEKDNHQNTEDYMDFWLRVFLESGSTGTDSSA